MLNVRSVGDLSRSVAANLHRLNPADFDVVVGVPRSGMIPASIIATSLQLPLSDLWSYARGEHWMRSGHLDRSGRRVLLVDDTSNKGSAMAAAVEAIKHRAREITRLAIYGPYRDDFSIIDMFFEECPGPRAFQWNFTKHARLPRWGFDMDGVLCRDPTRDENDRGLNYERFLREVRPMFIPRRPVGVIVTCRQDRYRAQTEAWLRAHGIEYGELVMSPKTRGTSKGLWKAGHIAGRKIEFFFESERKQAEEIAAATKLPVWHYGAQEVLYR